jgi:hypothetical protein
VNYTDRSTAAGRAKLVPTVVDRGCHAISMTDPYGRILDFLDRVGLYSVDKYSTKENLERNV